MRRAVSEQVVVITGGSSGIGLATALELGRRGASVVLAARRPDALQRAAADVQAAGGGALPVPTDVAVWSDVEALATAAVERFGRIDTWVNGAAVSAYGMLDDLPVEQVRRVLEVDLLGHFHGVKAVLPHMLARGQGAIIGLSSGLGVRAVPLQAPYCAAKAGVVGLMDALRLELEHQRAGISVTTIVPSSINTPLFDQAASSLGVKPAPIPPVYEPQVVADAIVRAIEHPTRDVVVGGAAKALTTTHRLAPRFADRLLLGAGQGVRRQRSGQPQPHTDGNVFAAAEHHGPRGTHGRFSLSRSWYTRLFEHHPNRRRMALVALAAAAWSGSIRT